MISLTPSHIIQYLYCPRFTFFEYVLAIPQYEEKDYKAMRGREVHDQKLERNKDYLRKRIGATEKRTDQYLTHNGLRGRVDEVLTLEDRSMSPLDYKFARYEGKVYETYRTQLYCYAWLIEENFQCTVRRGFLVYVRSQHKVVEIEVTADHKEMVREAVKEIGKIIADNYYPRATRYKKRCLTCTYRNICIK